MGRSAFGPRVEEALQGAFPRRLRLRPTRPGAEARRAAARRENAVSETRRTGPRRGRKASGPGLCRTHPRWPEPRRGSPASAVSRSRRRVDRKPAEAALRRRLSLFSEKQVPGRAPTPRAPPGLSFLSPEPGLRSEAASSARGEVALQVVSPFPTRRRQETAHNTWISSRFWKFGGCGTRLPRVIPWPPRPLRHQLARAPAEDTGPTGVSPHRLGARSSDKQAQRTRVPGPGPRRQFCRPHRPFPLPGAGRRLPKSRVGYRLASGRARANPGSV